MIWNENLQDLRSQAVKKIARGTTRMVNSYESLLQRNDLIEDVQNHFLKFSKAMGELTKIVLDNNDKDFEQLLASNPHLKKTLRYLSKITVWLGIKF